jgi:hypothetical protein
MKKSINFHYNTARKIALVRVEKLARTILRNHPQYNEFVMAMGTYFFTLKGSDNNVDTITSSMNASYNYVYNDTYKYFKPLNDFIGEWDKYLKLTGEPMRFTVKGKKVSNW